MPHYTSYDAAEIAYRLLGEGPALVCLAGEAVADSFPAARLRPLHEVGHYPWVDEPDLFRPVVEEFLDGRDGKDGKREGREAGRRPGREPGREPGSRSGGGPPRRRPDGRFRSRIQGIRWHMIPFGQEAT